MALTLPATQHEVSLVVARQRVDAGDRRPGT
jgi:hypothetical protein